MTDLVRPSLIRPENHDVTSLATLYSIHGHFDTAEYVANSRAALMATGRWVDGMDIADIICLVRTRYPVRQGTIYNLYELYPMGEMDPDLAPSILRRALRRHEDHAL